MADLSAWHTALGTVATAQARVLWVGDSIFEGTGATTLRKRALDLILDGLVRTHPVAGYGRCEYLPAHFAIPNTITPWAPAWATSSSGTVTNYNAGIGGDTGTPTNTFGLGMRSADMGTSAVLTYTVTGTDVDVWTCAGGSFAVSIDGGAYGTTITTTGQNAYADTTQVHLGASGSHTVAIKRVAGTVHFLGLTVYDGGRDKGIVLYDACHFGAAVPDFYDAATPSAPQNAKYIRNLQLVDPHLVVLNTGLNNDPSLTVDQVLTQYAALIDVTLATLPVASITACMVYNQASPDTIINSAGETYGYFYAQAKAMLVGKEIPALELASSMPNVWEDGGVHYQPDGLHMKDAGDVLAAQAVGMFVDPAYAVTPAIAVGASVSSTTPTSAPITTQETGSALLAVQIGAIPSASSLTLTDNKGNTFSEVRSLTYGGAYAAKVWVCDNAAGGSGHTFTQGGDPTLGSVSIVEIMDAATSGVVRASNGTVTLSAGPWPTGSATAVAGDLSVAFVGYDYDTDPATVTAGAGYSVETQSTSSSALHTAIATHAETGTPASTSFTPSPSQGMAGGFAFIATVKPSANVAVGLTGQSVTVARGAISVASSDVTVALTGRSVTTARGTFAAARSRALTGNRATDHAGAVKAAASKAILGQSIAASLGSVTAVSGGTSVALAGASVATAHGDVLPGFAAGLAGRSTAVLSGSVAASASTHLDGQAATASAGAVSAVPEVRVALSGASMSVQMGTVAAQHTAAVTGQDATYALGAPTAVADHSVSVALAGLSATADRGTLAPAHSTATTGQRSTTNTGTLTAVAGHNVSVGLTGVAITALHGDALSAVLPTLGGARIAAACGEMAVSRDVTVSGASAAFVAGSLTPRSGILITEPNRTALFAAEQRTATIAPDQRAARFAA
ncbi:hypothetical protein UU9_12378 [Rhodanobacter fulvus Jip2]|uniref:Uncharacterized protein n=1 Tax=Rhodanobacter fulvus Jip2 TaxID=1163408 RepID=I4VMV4_9GAMM|nr:hypothetical protein [Rhodanobacter fulvus]EIL88545.1 hypothetical protein UU9_12378 [Rhodanobacter fulvus Jip2]